MLIYYLANILANSHVHLQIRFVKRVNSTHYALYLPRTISLFAQLMSTNIKVICLTVTWVRGICRKQTAINGMVTPNREGFDNEKYCVEKCQLYATTPL